MFYHNIDPVLVEFGPFAIRYYGLIFATGLLVSFLIMRYLAKKKKLPLSSRDFDELLLISAVAVVVGARLGHVISSFGYYHLRFTRGKWNSKSGSGFWHRIIWFDVCSWSYSRCYFRCANL